MDLAKHQLLFSKSRLAKYISACRGNAEEGLRLYKYNIQACQALYPIISILEVALRNSLDRALSNYYDDPDWLVTQRADFADNALLVYRDIRGNQRRDDFFKDKLLKAERKLRYKKASINHVKLLADLTFGFWVKFFDSNPVKILKGAPLHAFTNKPAVRLAKVHSHLNSIVALRNRISHNEPICFDRNGKVCLDTLRQYEFDIQDALRWLDSDLKDWAEKMNFYRSVVVRIAAI